MSRAGRLSRLPGMRTRVLVVGGGYAGLLAAIRLARKSDAADVVLVDARPYLVERVRLHEDAAGVLRRRVPYATRLRGTRVGFVQGWVSGVDLEARRVRIGDEDVAFDELLLATGSIAGAAGIPGAEHAFPCANEEDVLRLRERLSGKTVIVGGGLTGVELAAELGERRPDLEVTLATGGPIAPSNGEEARAAIREALAARRVRLLEDTRVSAIEKDGVVLASGEALASAATILATGFVPSPLATQIGLAVDELGRARVDACLRSTSHPFVHVAGDAARVEVDAGAPLRMACATAMPMGAFAADDIARTIAGAEARPFRFAFYLQCTSLGRTAGLVQRVDVHDAPLQSWFGGRRAAWMKEALCRYTMLSMAAERRGFSYRWLRPPSPRPLRQLAA